MALDISLNLLLFFLVFSLISAEISKILHITDIHYDKFFKPNASILSFCHRLPVNEDEEVSNLLWGRGCDSSPALIEKSLKFMSRFRSDISMILLSGDNIRHNDDDMIPISRAEILYSNLCLKSLFDHYFPGIPTIFSIGNNDVYLHDSMRTGPNHDLSTLSDIWLMDDLSENSKSNFASKGFYTFDFGRNLTLISLNTLSFSKDNIFGVECSTGSSPGCDQLNWLIRELESCKNQNRRAIIIGHIPPLSIFYFDSCLMRLKQIFKNYSDIITCQLYGHIHIDDVFILKEDSLPVGFALTSPALAPISNPSFRVLDIDTTTGSLIDFHHYYLPLKGESNFFIKEYSCVEQYGLGPLDLEYFINMKLWEIRSSSERIKRKRYRAVQF